MKRGPHDDPREHREQLHIVGIRTREGCSSAEIAVELHCTPRTVQRYRAELRGQGVAVEPRRRLPDHGTVSRYQHRGCRCDECRSANAARSRAERGKPVLSHGASGYRRGCRCTVCSSRSSQQGRRHRQRRDTRKAAA